MRLFWAMTILLFGQEPPEPSIKVDVNLVNVAFIVRDGSGALSGNLTKDDVEVFEDGVKQDVRFFGRSADLPLRLALLADFSGSQEKFIRQHDRDIGKFLKTSVAARDRAMLVCFGNHVRVVSDFNPSPGELLARLTEFQKGGRHFPELEPDEIREGGTALFDALYLTALHKLMPERGERKAMILFSDGEDNASAHDLIDAIDEAQMADSLIYTVRYTGLRRGQLTARNKYGMLDGPAGCRHRRRQLRCVEKRCGGLAPAGVGRAARHVRSGVRHDERFAGRHVPEAGDPGEAGRVHGSRQAGVLRALVAC